MNKNSENFHCAEWDRVGYYCERQCDACAKIDNDGQTKPGEIKDAKFELLRMDPRKAAGPAGTFLRDIIRKAKK